MTDERSAPALTRGMRTTLIAVGAVVLVGIAVTIWLLVSAAGAGGPGAGPTASGSNAPSATATHGPVPGSTPTTGSEVLPPTSTAGPNQHPTPTPATPLVSPPLPKSGTKQGGLVAGFPAKIMGPIKGSDVISSSIATQGDTMQVTLVARTDTSEKSIRSHYEKLWASLGLSESGSSEGNPSYAGPYESLTLAVKTTGTGIQYSIYGVFRTK